jgi:hypothetical protein
MPAHAHRNEVHLGGDAVEAHRLAFGNDAPPIRGVDHAAKDT